MKVINLSCEYLGKRFHFISGCDKKAVTKWMSKTYKDEFGTGGPSSGCTWYWENKKGQLNIVLWVDPKLRGNEKLFTIMHEVGHAVFIMMKRAGVDPLDSVGEHFNYLQEYLTKQIVGEPVHKLKSVKTKRKIAKK